MKVKPGGAVGPFHSTRDYESALALCTDEHYNLELDVEFHESAGKTPLKMVPCTICRRPMVVNTFYVLAWAKCHESGCSGESKERGSVGVAQAGRTEPELAANLVETLINHHFQFARCPVHPDDEAHEMELKSVSHNPRYGPGEWRDDGKHGRVYVQIASGETVMHQCRQCKATVSYSTTPQSQYRRINEPKLDLTLGANAWGGLLGTRIEDPPEYYDGRDGSLEQTDEDREFTKGTDWENA